MADRRRTVYVDEFGREIGRHSARASSSSNREGSYREDPEIPRSESRRPDGPRRASTTTTAHSVGSSRHSTRDILRRESESLHTRPQLDLVDRSDPISIPSDSSKRYHSRSRGDNTYNASSSHEVPESSIPRRMSRSYHSPPSHERAVGSSDQLASSVAMLTMNDVVGSPRYPLTASQGRPLLADYDDDENDQFQLPSPTSMNQDIHVGSLKGKEKSLARDPLADPTTQGTTERVIRGTRGETEQLDSSYAKRSGDYKKFFRPGRVFSTLWTEAYDNSTNSEKDQFMSNRAFKVSYNQYVFSKIRRFVVVRLNDRNCTCLPVTTYDGKGYKKRGINLDDHGLIYSSSKPPPYVDGITKQPLRVILSKGAEKLVNPSYINYNRVYTVETNVKVKDVGDLDPESRRLLRKYYKEVHFRDFPDDDDNYTAPGPLTDPQQRDLVVAGAGAGFASNTSHPDYNTRGPYDRSSGSYSQHPGWDNTGGFASVTQNVYQPQPNYSQPLPPLAGNVPSYRYANVPAFDMALPQSGYQPSDGRYTQDPSAAGSNESFQSMHSRHPSHMYPSNTDPHWQQSTPAQPLYTTNATPLVSSGLYPLPEHGYNAAHNPIAESQYYVASSPAFSGGQLFSDHPAPDDRPTQTGPSFSRSSSNREYDDEVTLPTFEEAQTSRRPRYESVNMRPPSGRGRDWDQSRDQVPDSGRRW